MLYFKVHAGSIANALSTIVSDPEHERYGNHLSAEEVHELIKPTKDASEQVHDWLLDNGVEAHSLDYSPAKDWIKVTLPVSAIERLLDTKYSVFEHEDGTEIVRTTKWSLPEHLHEHIEAIQPTNSFFRAEPRSTKFKPVSKSHKEFPKGFHFHEPSFPNGAPTVAQACNATLVTPTCLRTLYKTFNYKPRAPGKNAIGLTDYLGEANNFSDVNIFLEQFRPQAAGFKFDVQVIAGGDNQQTPNTPAQDDAGKDLEGNLDAETIIGATWPTPLIAYTTGGSPPFTPDGFTPTDTNEPYLTWLDFVLKQKKIPQTISTSYGDDEQTVPKSYAVKVCREFAQLGARGVSLLFASGDNGVGTSDFCFSNDGKNTTTFLPSFPDGCPYVTSVGATKNFAPEVVAFDEGNQFASGGGYSNYFPTPFYQKRVVEEYTKSLKGEFKGLFNPNGRAYPDLSAQGQRYATIWNGTIAILDGTSAATPTASSVISLINDARIAAGLPPLGFLNPWLYSKGFLGFNDITNGSAIGCGTSAKPLAGFPAKCGWDAVTGFGTPDFEKLKALAGVFF